MNLILVIIDTLRYDHIAANARAERRAAKGSTPKIRTPNLDRLVARSWNYTRAFTASFPTIPHRNDVIKGRYGAPFHRWQPLDYDVPNIPRVLRENGYCSQLLHDTPHLVQGGHHFDYPFDAWTPIRGAEVDRSWIHDTWEYMDNWAPDPLFDSAGTAAIEIDRETLMRKHHAITCYVHTNRGRKSESDWNVARLFAAGAQFLHDNRSRDNFFLWLDCFDPHEPWDAPPDYVRLYDPTPGYDGRIDPRAFHFRNAPDLSQAARKRVAAFYQAKVTLVDTWFGKFLDALDETGLADNTALLLTADHGTNVGDRPRPGLPGHFGKSSPPRENESHVPFIVYAPGVGVGQSEMLVQPQDIFGTLLSIAGLQSAVPERIESHDVLTLARKGSAGRRALALGGSAVSSWQGADPEKVLFSAYDREWRLGVAADPAACKLERLGTQENVASDHPQVVERLYAAALTEIARRGLDPALLDWLKQEGKTGFPTEYRVTDAQPLPKGWRNGYWLNMYESLGLAS
jgi:arylsulfatase A-like enzyme